MSRMWHFYGARLCEPQQATLANRAAACHRPALHFQFRIRALNHRAAFSLIEVMVAILILAIALTGLTAGITTALKSSKESELQTTAALFASGQIELLRAQTDWTDGTEQGDCGATLPLYRWQQTVSPTDISGLHEVDVVVENSHTGQEIYELKTMLFQIPDDSQRKGNSAKPKGNQS
jgi:prepilin-type N-terminal cleavage/methylation domain-containing protein